MKQDPRYTDLMQEIKERLYTIDIVSSGRTALDGPLAHDFVFCSFASSVNALPMRAFSRTHTSRNPRPPPKFQKEWSADELMKQLGRLHQDFVAISSTVVSPEIRLRPDNGASSSGSTNDHQ
jgi:hypothetical protein